MPAFERALSAARIALAAAALTVVPAMLRAQSTCDTGDPEVRDLDFRGNRAISDDDLALRVVTTPSAWLRRVRIGTKRCLSPRMLPRDVAGLRAYYRERGFYEATVESQVDSLGPSSVHVVFNIDEGQPTILTSYTITGLEGVRDSADIARRLRLKVGERWDLGLFQADIDSVVSRLRNAGYFRATVFPRRHSDTTRTAQAAMEVVTGKLARFADTDPAVTPAPGRDQQISDETVKRLLGITPGQLFSDRAIRDAQRNLFQLATYRQVEVQPLRPDSQPSDTLVFYDVRLTEDYMRELDTEFGWATLDCFRTYLQFTDKNAFKSARRLELTARATKLGYGHPLKTEPTRQFCRNAKLGKNQLGIGNDEFSDSLHYYLGATLRQPRLLGTRVVPTMSIYSERRGEFRAYLRHTHVGGDFSATRDVANRTPIRLGYSIEYGKTDAPAAAMCALFNRCDAESRGFLTRLRPLGVASLSLARVRTDNPLSPTRGSTFRAELRTAQPWLFTPDSQAFNKATGDFAYYVPMGRSVLALRLRGGVVLGRTLALSNERDFIPPQERLYAGGPTSVRGFQQNELGDVVYIARRSDIDSIAGTTPGTFTFFPTVDTLKEGSDSLPNPERTAPLGGNSLFVANLEFRTRLPFLLPDLVQFTTFLDGGDVWSRDGAFQMKWAPGLGIRVATPIGPVQVNVAQQVSFSQTRPERTRAPLFFNPDVRTLACATPGNNLEYSRAPNGELVQATTGGCPDYTPPERRGLRRLTFTFSIGSDF